MRTSLSIAILMSLAVLSLPARGTAQEAQIDLAKLEARHKQHRPLYVSAPSQQITSIKLLNLVPGASYTVDLPGAAPPQIQVSTPALPQAGSGGIGCDGFRNNPAGKLLRASDERAVAQEVKRIRKAVERCDQLTRQKVEDAINLHTTVQNNVSLTISGESIPISIARPPLLQMPVTLSTCTPEAQLEAYLKGRLGFASQLRVLALDHQQKTWAAYAWDGQHLTDLDDSLLEVLPTENRAQLALNRGEETAVFVVNTNPLLYGISGSSAAETDIPQAQDLQKLAGLLGGFASARLDQLALNALENMPSVNAASTQMQSIQPQSNPLSDSLIRRGIVIVQGLDVVRRETPQDIVNTMKAMTNDPLDEIRDAATSTTSAVAQALDKLKTENKAFDSEAAPLKKDLQDLDNRSSEVKAYLQGIEQDANGVAFLEPSSEDILSKLGSSYAKLQATKAKLAGLSIKCTKSLKALEEAVSIRLKPLPTNRLEQIATRERYLKLLDELSSTEVTKDGCDEIKLSPPPVSLDTLLPQISGWLRSNEPTLAEPSDPFILLFEPIRKSSSGYLVESAARDERLKNAGELLLKQGTVSAQAAALQQFDRRQAANLANPRPSSDEDKRAAVCSLRKGVIAVAPLAGQELRPKFAKIHTEDFMVKADPTLKKDLTLNHPEDITGKYGVKNLARWSKFDVSFGVIYTDLTDPTFTAVPVTPDMDDSPTIITRTDQDSRAGEIGLFANFHWLELGELTVGPQLGAGVDTSKPAFFLGGTLGWRETFKFSFGWTTQRVTELAGGQEEDMMLQAGQALRTKKGFDDSWYAGLSISLGGLPFFKPAEK